MNPLPELLRVMRDPNEAPVDRAAAAYDVIEAAVIHAEEIPADEPFSHLTALVIDAMCCRDAACLERWKAEIPDFDARELPERSRGFELSFPVIFNNSPNCPGEGPRPQIAASTVHLLHTPPHNGTDCVELAEFDLFDAIDEVIGYFETPSTGLIDEKGQRDIEPLAAMFEACAARIRTRYAPK